MKQITFTITEDEIRKIAETDISDEKIQSVLTMVEGDEVLWNEIQKSIVAVIQHTEEPMIDSLYSAGHTD